MIKRNANDGEIDDKEKKGTVDEEDSRNNDFCIQNCSGVYGENHDEENNQFIRIHHGRVGFSMQLCLTVIIAFTFLVPLAVVSKVFVALFKERDTSLISLMMYADSQLVTVSSALVFSMFGTIALKRLFRSEGLEQLARDDSKEMVVQISFLMISLTGLCVAQCLELTTILDHTYLKKILRVNGKDYPDCYIMLNFERLTGFLTVVLGCLQTLFIVGALSLKKTRQRRNKTLVYNGQTGSEQDNEQASNIGEKPLLRSLIKLVTVIILICNITLWLSKTLDMSGLYCHPLFCRLSYSWHQFSNIVYPFWIFFHFHFFALCVEILC